VSIDLPRRNEISFSFNINKYTKISTGLYQKKRYDNNPNEKHQKGYRNRFENR
jgi:hypothetical protein